LLLPLSVEFRLDGPGRCFSTPRRKDGLSNRRGPTSMGAGRTVR